MTLRQKGRRVKRGAMSRRNNTAQKPVSHRKTQHKRDVSDVKERRQLIQLVVCGSIFVLVVVTKLLIPSYVEELNQMISAAIEQNMDVRAVFSTVGKAFSGETALSESAGELYRAVFAPEESMVKETSAQIPTIDDEWALSHLKQYQMKDSSDIELHNAEEAEKIEEASLAYVLYSNQTLPERVSMEQVLLGFDYCTPVSGTISSEFGYREHPTEGEEKFHYGLDLAADNGTDILCFADGTVTAIGESSSYGKYCMVIHENDYSTLYAHCDRILVSSGSFVRRGDVIAEVGETGMATGPHLHFELQCDGVYLNPIYYVSSV